jgi:hypothetical protein
MDESPVGRGGPWDIITSVMSLEQARSHGAEGILSEMDAPSPVLVIAFGGLALSIVGTPPFEFFRMLDAHAPTRKLFVRDHQRSWYHRGVREFAELDYPMT